MIFADFPISGDFRFILMIFEWIFAVICLEFGFLFWFRHKKEQHKLKYSQDIGYILLFFALSLKSILSVLGSYFSYSSTTIAFHHFLSQISLYSGFIVFIIIKEKQRLFLFKKYFFSICLSILLLLFILLSFLNNQLIIFDLILFLSITFTFFLLFYLEFIKRVKIQNGLSIKIITSIIPFSLLLIGLFLTSDYSMDLLQLQFRLIGSLIQLLGIAFFAFFFLKFPTLSEFDWKDKIEEVLLINKHGACLFYKSYIEKVDSYNENLISGAISLVNIMLKEILKPESREVSVIKKKGKLTYIFPSDLITGVIFSKKESKNIQFYIKQLVIKIEQVYKNILLNWDGDLGIFDPIEDIFEEILSK